ncbi:MAG: MFS transporter [Propionibacteriaceae bacterium]
MSSTIVHDPRRARRAVVAAGLGNVLEWYDIIVYAFMAPVISVLFFPNTDPTVALISTYLGVGVSYLIRPVGALVIGNFGDRRGRKAALTLTIGLMTLGVAIMAFAPTYATIGVGAPIVLMISRLIQGFSAGGEFGSATTFMTENAQQHKAYYASWQVATQGGAMLLAGLSGWLLFSFLDPDALSSWGWRLPFIFGILIGPVGLWIRARMDETPEFVEAEKLESAPIAAAFRTHLGRILVAAMCVGLATMSVYLITYLPAFAMTLGLPDWSGYAGAVLAGLIALVLSPLVGKLADRVGQTRIMLGAAIVGMIVVLPIVQLIISTGAVWALLLAEAVLGLLMAAYFAPLPSLMTQMFPVQVRTTGMSVAYNVGVTSMGSFAPAILAGWVQTSLLAPGFYYIIVGVISVVGLVLARRLYDQP